MPSQCLDGSPADWDEKSPTWTAEPLGKRVKCKINKLIMFCTEVQDSLLGTFTGDSPTEIWVNKNPSVISEPSGTNNIVIRITVKLFFSIR